MSLSSDGPRADDIASPLRVYAESCILHFLGRLEGEAERRLREVDLQTLRFEDAWLDRFLGDWSIPASALDFIQKQWEEESVANPELTATEFARRWAEPLFSPWVTIR